MKSPTNVTTGCLLVGDYVDEAECPTDVAVHCGEAVRPTLVANYIDPWGRDDGLREFTVLLKDGRVVAVRGHGLKHERKRPAIPVLACAVTLRFGFARTP